MVNHFNALFSLATLTLSAQSSLSIQDAIRTAWSQQTGLQAGEAMVLKARLQAEAMQKLRYPSASLGVGLIRTDEPMMAFGTKLDQARISQMDFMPSALNRPNPVTGTGATLTFSQPLYAGGRLDAARNAGQAMAEAETSSQNHRKQQVAFAVTQAYFGAQVAEQGLRYAEDTLKQAIETEKFVQARVDQGMMLKSEADRTKAFRAQSEASVAEAKSRIASAKSALNLLLGMDIQSARLASPVEQAFSESSDPGRREDIQAAKYQAQAAKEGVTAAEGTLKPEVGLQATLGTMRQSFNQGGNWTTVALGVKWSFAFKELEEIKAAKAQMRAAELAVKWQEAQARRDVEEARRIIQTAKLKIEFAKTALEASESVRAARTARHREGLLPLVEVLDAESALTGARALLLACQLDHRVGQAQLALTSGQPVENVKD